ncbi:RidA family protein [Paraburkholderia unamae]|uniref:RidA family protein n=1 Tax=Paraburkholderia unamae TaxID=219649 RepID=A0ACC6RQH5_9BURK
MEKCDVYETIKTMGIELPQVSSPAAAYTMSVRSGATVYLAGHLPRDAGAVVTGKLGATLSTEEGREAARKIAVDLLATLHAKVGNLNHVKQIVKLTSFVNSAAGFSEQHLVTNGASELLAKVFGEAGVHARSAVGVAELPLNACVEIELIVEIAD